MPARGIQHVDLAVRDVEQSLAFYRGVLGPLGLQEKFRNLTYRNTEEVIYLEYGVQGLGLRPADGGVYRHYDVGIEHSPSRSTSAARSTRRTDAASGRAGQSSRHPSSTMSKTARTITPSLPLIRTASGSRSSAGQPRRTAERNAERRVARRISPPQGRGEGENTS